MLYQLNHLQKTYGNRTVLDIPFLTIGSGKIYALQGPNGAGKSTLLHILAFLQRPSSGAIQYNNRPVPAAEAQLNRLRRQVVLVDQNPIMFSTTVYKNVEFGLKIRAVPRQQRRARIEQALALVGMEQFATASAFKLSGGETQRVALARALVLDPKVLLCDEPTASIDTENQTAVIEILRRINAENNISIVFTTHDRRQTDVLAHQTLSLNQGRLTGNTNENVFLARIETTGETVSRCILADRISLSLPTALIAAQVGSRIQVHLDPCAILIAARTAGFTANNTFDGRITRISAENGRVRLQVAAAVDICVRLSMSEYRRQKLMVGEEVRLHVGEDAVTVV